MSFRFTPQDFENITLASEAAADRANALLEAEEKKCVRVYWRESPCYIHFDFYDEDDK